VELTTVHANDAGGSTLKVNDAHYFQDGTWGSVLSPVEADWIAVGDPANMSEIASISYSADEITLVVPISRSPGDPIWPFKDSSGERVLFGDGPDIGAHERQ